MSRVLPRTLDTGAGLLMKAIILAAGRNRALPQKNFYEILWTYYLSNGLYDELRLMGHYMDNSWLSELRNPAYRVVEFYPAVIWPGPIDHGLPLVMDNENDAAAEAIHKLWDWSNWANQRQVAVRWAAIQGDIYLKVAQPADESKRVYLQLIDPQYVIDKEADERGYLTFCRIDIPFSGKPDRDTGERGEDFTYTEIWDQERWRRWRHDKEPGVPIARLGEPELEVTLSSWGIDFVPIVHIRHLDIGGDFGIGAYTLQLSKIDQANLQATRLHKMLYRHNDVTWALTANANDASGRPLPPPRINDSDGNATDVIELGGEKLLRLPGMSKLESLVPNLQYDSALEILRAMVDEIERDLPEAMYSRIKDLPEVSGKALRLMLAPAVAKAHEVRGNHEDGLIRAQKMALTIGSKIGAWQAAGIKDVGSYESGAFEHHFAERPVISLGRDEVAELAQTETAAGIPLITSLRNSGWSQDDLDRMADDKKEEQEAQKTSLASAVMEAQQQMGGPQFSNGMEQPDPGVPTEPTMPTVPTNGNGAFGR